METGGGYRLTFLFLVAIVVPATALAFVSITAIRHERDAFMRQTSRLHEERAERLRDAATQAVARPASAAAEVLAESPRRARSLEEVRGTVKRLAASADAFGAGLLLGPDGALVIEDGGLRAPSRKRDLARLDRLFRPAEDLEDASTGPRGARAALDKYDQIAASEGNDPHVMVEVLAARGRLFPRAFAHESEQELGRIKAEEAYRELVEHYGAIRDRDGTLLSLGARLRLAAIYRERGEPEREAVVLEEMIRFLARHEAALGEGVDFYRARAAEKLLAIDPSLASAALVAAEQLASNQAADLAFEQAYLATSLSVELTAALRGEGPDLITLDKPRFLRASAARPGTGLSVLAIPIALNDALSSSSEGASGRRALALFRVDVAALLQRLLPELATAPELPEGGRLVLRGPMAPADWNQVPEPAAVVSRTPLEPPFDRHELVSYREATQETLPFGKLGDSIRVWAIALAALGLAIGAIVMTLAIRKEMLEAQLKSGFVTTVTHELKTPLTSIGMFAEMLLMGRVEDEAEEKECLEIIVKETGRLSRLIDRVLTFSKIEANKKRFELRLTDLRRLCEETIELFQRQMRGGNQEFTVELNLIHDLDEVLCDRPAIEEVLLNLLHNAYKYGGRGLAASRTSHDPEGEPPPTRIQMAITKRRGWVEVSVRDWGIGVGRRDRRRIFGKFYRANDVLTRDVEGSGIGLTLARSIARAHRGDITVRSKLGHGSTFSLWLPR
ncbi:MAG: sensor histidine kinase [Planctomycetota bacterium]